MGKVRSIVWVVTLFVLMMMVRHSASLSCKTVVDGLLPCKGYLTKGGALTSKSKCCSSIRALDRQANNPSDRQTACKCLKLAGKAYKVNQKYAAKVPSTCKVNVGYAISYSTDCAKVR